MANPQVSGAPPKGATVRGLMFLLAIPLKLAMTAVSGVTRVSSSVCAEVDRSCFFAREGKLTFFIFPAEATTVQQWTQQQQT